MGLKEDFISLTGAEATVADIYLRRSLNSVLEYTHRSEIPVTLTDIFENIQLDLAVSLYEQRGMESATSLSEGGVSTSMMKKGDILKDLNDYRKAKIGGSYNHETTSTDA